MDARGRASFVFEDVTGRRWPRVKRIVLVLVVLKTALDLGLHLAEHRGPPATTGAVDEPEPARSQPGV